MSEVWREVKGLEEFYLVSNLGRVRSKKSGKFIASSTQGSGYVYITLYYKGCKISKLLHVIVAEAFVYNHFGYKFVYFKDGNRDNCVATNLKWVEKNRYYNLNFHKNFHKSFTNRQNRQAKNIIEVTKS